MHSIKHNRLEAAVLFAIQYQVSTAVSYSEIVARINTAPLKKSQSHRLNDQIDTYFVGGLGTDQMGAVTVAFPLGQIVVGLGLLFGNGAAAYLSRLLGRGDKDTANKVASTAIYSGVSIGAVVILLSVIFLEPILKQAGAIESVMPYGNTMTAHRANGSLRSGRKHRKVNPTRCKRVRV